MPVFAITPRKEAFFDMFDRSAQNVHAAAKALLDFLEHYEDHRGQEQLIGNP